MVQELATADLSDRERELVARLASYGGDFERAALDVGYQSSGISVLKAKVTRKPAFLAALHVETARQIFQAAPAALAFVTKLVRDENASPKLRLDAAKTLLDRAGHIAPRARALGDGTEKTLGEMSLDELKATQDRLQAEILNRAKPVNAHETAPNDDQALDLLG